MTNPSHTNHGIKLGNDSGGGYNAIMRIIIPLFLSKRKVIGVLLIYDCFVVGISKNKCPCTRRGQEEFN